MTARELIKSWLEYTKQNGIKTDSNPSGRVTTVGDVMEFMQAQGFDADMVSSILDQIDTVPAEPEVSDEDQAMKDWADALERLQTTGDDDGVDGVETDDVMDGDLGDSDVEPSQGDVGQGADGASPESTSSVRDIDAEDGIDEETRKEELMAAKRIIKRMSRSQQRQLYRELKHV